MTKRNMPKVAVTTRPGVRADVSPRSLERWSPEVSAADAEGENTISVLDVIGADWFGDGVTAKRIAAALRQIGDNPVTVIINSPGGDFFEGLAIYNILREHPQPVTVKIVGLAASAASVIAMAGDEIRIARAGFLMIHNAWVMAAGDRNAFREIADWLEPFDAAMADVYSARTGMPAAEIAPMLDRETWIGGQAAVDQGFADALLTSDDVAFDAKAHGDGPRAERKFDILAARAGMSKGAARDLLRALKSGMSGAAQDGQPGAADIEAGLRDLLKTAKTL